MSAGHREARVIPLTFCLDREGHAVGLELQVLAHEVRAGAVETVADHLVARHSPGQRPGLRIVEVEHRFARAVEEMREQFPQLDQLLVVKADVGQHRNFGLVQSDRAVALVDFADEQLGVADERTGERR